MFSFPLLTNAEILACLDELELGFTENMLLEPQRHRDEVRNVFEQLAELCCGVSRETIARHARVDSEKIPYAQLHEESTVELAVFRGVADLLRRSGVGDFGLRDWHAPSTKRLKKHLSGVINFAKFREDRLAEYVGLCQRRDCTIEAAASAQRDALEAQEEVAEVERDTLEARREVAQAEDACAQFVTDAEAFGRLEASASSKRDDLLDAARVLGEDVAASLEEVKARDQEASRVRDTDAPIPTPQELEARLHAMEGELQAIDNAHQDHSQELEKATTECRRCEEAAPLIQKCAHEVEAVEADVAAHRARLAELRTVERQNDTFQTELRQLDDCLRVADGNADLARKRVDDCAEQVQARSDRDARALASLRDELGRLAREAPPRLALRRHLEARAAEARKDVVPDASEDAWIDACAADLAAALRATHDVARELPPPPVLA